MEALDATEVASEFVVDENPSADRTVKRSRVVDHYQRIDKSSDALHDKLTAQQRTKLPAVYLHTEGLMALCRPQFGKVFNNPETQGRIRELTGEVWSKKASPLHRALFGLQTLDLAPLLEVELRQVAYRLDCQIIDLLNETERKRLWDIISKTHDLRRVTHGAPAY